jgi:cytoplasmic tRNA 2-thiolation protein 1
MIRWRFVLLHHFFEPMIHSLTHSLTHSHHHLQTVKQNQVEYGLPLKILSYDELYGWTMDKIVEQIGKKNNCTFSSTDPGNISPWTIQPEVESKRKTLFAQTGTFCGVFRRQALDRGAAQLGVDHIVTGHIAETVLMNSQFCQLVLYIPGFFNDAEPLKFSQPVMRGDIARLSRCTALSTSSEDTITRSKPFKYAYEKEIVM